MRAAALLLALASAGCAARPPAEPPRLVATCILRDGGLVPVAAELDPRTGDTLVAGRPFAAAHPRTDEYAQGRGWFAANEPMRLYGYPYLKYGPERRVPIDSIRPLTAYRGTSVFADTGALTPSHLLYVPVRPGCVFQPYVRQLGPAPVREPRERSRLR